MPPVTIRHRSRKADVPTRQRPQGHNLTYRFRSEQVENEHIRVLKDQTSQQLNDPFDDRAKLETEGTASRIIKTPYNFASLLKLPQENNMLRQCIDVMVTNVEGHGHRLEYIGPEDQEASAEAVLEKNRLEGFLARPNDIDDLPTLRGRWRCDLETLGVGYYEVGRDRQGVVCVMYHVPGHTVRLLPQDEEMVEVAVEFINENGKFETRVIKRRFRRYVQIIGNRKTFFKEYGDPRPMDPKSGKFEPGMGLEESATELRQTSLYTPGTAYGLPRWINQLPSILGSRQAELTNLDFFKENAIPAMALMVSGGYITQETLEQIEGHFMAARGRDSFNRILVIEAQGDDEAVGDDGKVPAPRLKLEALQGARQQDGLFQEYDKSGANKVRSSFRIPPIFVGLAEDYTMATARTSYDVAESQVFGPERIRSDKVINTFLDTFKPRFWQFRSNPPKLSSPQIIADALDTFDKLGAMTPNVAIGLINEFFDLEVPIVEAEWGNLPFELVKALATKGVELDGVGEVLEGLPGVEDDDGTNLDPVQRRVRGLLRDLRGTIKAAP